MKQKNSGFYYYASLGAAMRSISKWDLPGEEHEGNKQLAQDRRSHWPGSCWGGGQNAPVADRMLCSVASRWGWSIQSSNEMIQPDSLCIDNLIWMHLLEWQWRKRNESGEGGKLLFQSLYESKHWAKSECRVNQTLRCFLSTNTTSGNHLDSKLKACVISHVWHFVTNYR